MATAGNFSGSQYWSYPASGYTYPTTVDDDYDTKGFKYVWFPLYVPSGVTASANASYKNIIDDVVQNAIIANNTTGGLTDLNDADRNHIYVILSGISNIQNYPPTSNGGTLLCFAAYNQHSKKTPLTIM